MLVLSSLLLGVVSGVYGRVLGGVVGPLSVAFVLQSHGNVEGVVVGHGRIRRPPARATPTPQTSSSDSHHEAPTHI